MKSRLLSFAILILTAMSVLPGSASAQQGTPQNTAPQSTKVASAKDQDAIEGEKRFHANCGRCHAPPGKFPPRMMATIVRHMRVRAMLTDQDMRLILKLMTQ
jgi:mono/diheme cytochrome c family protein